MGGWHIEVFNASTGISVGNATTDSSGFWRVCNLLHGVYRVQETLQPDYENVTTLNRTEILGCTNLSGVNFFNDPLFCISGYKLDNCTKLGLPDWEVVLTNASGEVDRTTTNTTGYYEFCDLKPGAYTITETLQSGYVSVTPAVLTPTLPCTGNLTNQNFTNQELLCINGTKLDNCTGRGLADWTIELKNSTGSVIKTATTGPDGTYSFCKLVPGNYTVSEVVDPDYIATGPTSIDVELECADSENNDFKNTALLCINGTKLDNCTGRGLADWTIELKNSTGSVIKTATTGPDGTYSFCEPGPRHLHRLRGLAARLGATRRHLPTSCPELHQHDRRGLL